MEPMSFIDAYGIGIRGDLYHSRIFDQVPMFQLAARKQFCVSNEW